MINQHLCLDTTEPRLPSSQRLHWLLFKFKMFLTAPNVWQKLITIIQVNAIKGFELLDQLCKWKDNVISLFVKFLIKRKPPRDLKRIDSFKPSTFPIYFETLSKKSWMAKIWIPLSSKWGLYFWMVIFIYLRCFLFAVFEQASISWAGSANFSILILSH